jgi:hypothetical protein
MDSQLLTVGAFIKDPLLWLTTVGGAALGLVTPETFSGSQSLYVGLLALLGGLLGKLLQIWLDYRKQNRDASDSQLSRFERLLKEEREAHDKTEQRYLQRIKELEEILDGPRRRRRLDDAK